jgi:hypothetical protein
MINIQGKILYNMQLPNDDTYNVKRCKKIVVLNLFCFNMFSTFDKSDERWILSMIMS